MRFRWNDCLVQRQWCLPLTKQHCWSERCCFTFVCALSALPIRLFAHLCSPFALAYLDVSFFYHILFRLGNFFWLMWCGSIDADVRTIHWCLEFSRFISLLLSLTFILFFSLSMRNESSPFTCSPCVYACMHDFPFFYSIVRTLMAFTFIYIHHVDFVIISTILFVSNFYRLTTAISFFLAMCVCMFLCLLPSLSLCLGSSVVHYRHEKLLNTTLRRWILREKYIWMYREKDSSSDKEKSHSTIIDLFPGLL